MKSILILPIFLFLSFSLQANIINADASNYTTFLNSLSPGDTLLLAPGNYKDRLNIRSLMGTDQDPIVIMGSGNSTSFLGNACCNTVSIKESAFITFINFKIDGQNIKFIDAIKAEGTTGNWTHHIVIENILIVGHGNDQQTVGISTKCPSWDWIIRKCTIIGAGTGMYLGNSNGEAPFVNGVVENNLVMNTVGYNIQIKHQNVGSRNIQGMTLNGKTIIRHNVLSKEKDASSGGSSRPNLLVGNFPSSGDGVDDYYEIYGNFLWQNPTESLFQGTGNIAFYDNVCVNYAGGNGITIQNHNGFRPRDVKVFHNTIICDVNWGIRFSDTNPGYEKYIYGNAVFSDHSTPIRIVGGGSSTANILENVVGGIANAPDYFNNPTDDITSIDLYPKSGSALKSTIIPNSLFTDYTDSDIDFNQELRTWEYRGSYYGDGINTGWNLAIELKDIKAITTKVSDYVNSEDVLAYPNPTQDVVQFNIPFDYYTLNVFDINGKFIKKYSNISELDLSYLHPGTYLIIVASEDHSYSLLIERK